jgi:hypothetical protein
LSVRIVASERPIASLQSRYAHGALGTTSLRTWYNKPSDLPRQVVKGDQLIYLCGAGCILSRLLKRFGLEYTPGCQCENRANKMDGNGPAWCRENFDMIVGWMMEEADKRGLWAVGFLPDLKSAMNGDMQTLRTKALSIAKRIVTVAIRKAERHPNLTR